MHASLLLIRTDHPSASRVKAHKVDSSARLFGQWVDWRVRHTADRLLGPRSGEHLFEHLEVGRSLVSYHLDLRHDT